MFVNRGFVPLDRKDAATRREGQVAGVVTVTGLLRMPEGRSWFTPADDPAHGISGRSAIPPQSPRLMVSRARRRSLSTPTLPPIPAGCRRAAKRQLVFPNRHLEYAITWFGLALALFAVFVAFARKQLTSAGRA